MFAIGASSEANAANWLRLVSLIVFGLAVAATPGPVLAQILSPSVLNSADAPARGTWVPKGSSTNTNVGCFQVWTCDVGAQLTGPGQHVQATPEIQTPGVCSAGGGDAGSCNYCTASLTPPTTQCSYTIVSDPPRPQVHPPAKGDGGQANPYQPTLIPPPLPLNLGVGGPSREGVVTICDGDDCGDGEGASSGLPVAGLGGGSGGCHLHPPLRCPGQ